ncbi:serine/threonine protein kinase [Clostridium putrefaciens]|uniref:non-specific serine/threonine protein kinase n=1 Tax=Clostridium putrefaciens TaxID=99675 RepID=A0A381J8G9_9CLOT|nr:Stk1 family PASTA domain-containing Ser/Thr kinase [Clostridium putrefaciens]SUY47299.1 serine/threonine protein kinase [Clostridium putrefaciens]
MMIGTILGDRYELLEKIGEGGMAVVYKARCHKLNRFDAVKILKKEFISDGDLVNKFKKEATAIANLSDNNIVNIFDVGSQGDINYIVMEYVRGKTLKEVIKENGRLPYDKVLDYGIQISKALDCAHRNNIIHRDIKPQNILVTEEGVLKVTDFGIAKSPDSATITNSKKILGSAHYFSPEQAKGSYIDATTDIYSLGIVLYEMVTGRVPFDAESPVSVALKHIQESPIPPKQIVQNIPESLNKLILTAIEKEPAKRYKTAKDIMNDLIKIQKDPDSKIHYSNVDSGFTRIMDPVNQALIQEDLELDKTIIDDDDDKQKTGVTKRSKKIIIISLMVVLAISLGLLSAYLMDRSSLATKKNKEVTVPKILNLTKEEAKNILESNKLKIEVAGTEKSDKKEGTIIDSNPKEGQVAKEGDIVKVIISGGISSINVPDLKDINIKSAKDMIASYELEVGNIDSDFSDKVMKDNVIRQDPSPDKQVEKGTKINLVVSKGPKIILISVPNVMNVNVNDAENTLKGSKMTVNKSTEETADKSKDQKVFYQSIEANTKVEVGSNINIKYYVYKEPEPVKVVVPNVINTKVNDAENVLKNAKLTVNISTEETPDKGKDQNVSYQSIEAGTKVEPGSTINIKYYVYKEPVKPVKPADPADQGKQGEPENQEKPGDKSKP